MMGLKNNSLPSFAGSSSMNGQIGMKDMWCLVIERPDIGKKDTVSIVTKSREGV